MREMLPCTTVGSFLVAVLESLHRYKELLLDLQVAYGKYQNGIRYVESQQEYREGIELDLKMISGMI